MLAQVIQSSLEGAEGTGCGSQSPRSVTGAAVSLEKTRPILEKSVQADPEGFLSFIGPLLENAQRRAKEIQAAREIFAADRREDSEISDKIPSPQPPPQSPSQLQLQSPQQSAQLPPPQFPLQSSPQLSLQSPPQTTLSLSHFPNELLIEIFLCCGTNTTDRLSSVLPLGRVCRSFLEASRSPVIFDHIDFISHSKRPVDHLIAAARSRARPEFIRLYASAFDLPIVSRVLEKCDLSCLRSITLYSVSMSPSISTSPPPFLNTSNRDGIQRLPLTDASLSFCNNEYNEAIRSIVDNTYIYRPIHYTQNMTKHSTTACDIIAKFFNRGRNQRRPPNLHVTLDSFDANKLGTIAYLSSLELRNVCISFVDLNLTPLLFLSKLTLGSRQGNLYKLQGTLISPSIRTLDVTGCLKGFSICSVRCPELREVLAHIYGGFGINLGEQPI